jgi:hypothetical protein
MLCHVFGSRLCVVSRYNTWHPKFVVVESFFCLFGIVGLYGFVWCVVVLPSCVLSCVVLVHCELLFA